MGGTWESQNKILPGAYINISTNAPLSITPGERGIVVILQEMSKGTDGDLYRFTATSDEWPRGATTDDKKLVSEALKGAKEVVVYKLKNAHDVPAVEEALKKLKTVNFNTLCYPFDVGKEAQKQAIVTWIKAMRNDEGVKCQAVLANTSADTEGVINIVQGVLLADGRKLKHEEVTAWVAGISAGAGISESNTGKKYLGAVDVVPRMTKSEMETALGEGKFIFKVDSAQNVSVVYDINSFTSVSIQKGRVFMKNRVVRTLDNIANDVAKIFEANYIGKVSNNEEGRMLLKSALVDYFTVLQNLNAIEDFETNDVNISAGADKDAVVVDVMIKPVDSVEKIYITVNLM